MSSMELTTPEENFTGAVGSLHIYKTMGTVAGHDIGVIKGRCGTKDEKAKEAFLIMLDEFKKQGRAAESMYLKENPTQFPFVYRLYTTQKLHLLPTSLVAKDDLETVLLDWVDEGRKKNGEKLGERTKRNYRNSFVQMLKLAPKNSTLQNLPDVVKTYRDHCVKNEYWSPFNNLLTAVKSFIQDTQPDKEDSELYKKVKKNRGVSTKRKREANGQQVWEVRALMAKLVPREAQHVWNMFCTGMRHGEYAEEFGCSWSIEADRIVINGRKNDGALRYVPKIDGVVKVPYVKTTMIRHLREASEDTVVPGDFRASYQQLIDEVIGNNHRINFYEGHPTSDTVKKRYRTHDVSKHLKNDTKALNEFIAENMEPQREKASSNQFATLKVPPLT